MFFNGYEWEWVIFPENSRCTGGIGFSLTGNYGAGSKILPREGLYIRWFMLKLIISENLMVLCLKQPL